MRCPDCNKMVSYDTDTEPEINLEVSNRTITGDVRIVLTCAECGTELKEYTFDVDTEVDVPEDHVCKLEGAEGCPEHVVGASCPVCHWDGTVKPSREVTDLTITRYDPPQHVDLIDNDVITKINWKAYGMSYQQIFVVGEEKEMEAFIEKKTEETNGIIPSRRPTIPSHEEENSFEVSVDTEELTVNQDCGVNKKTGKPNKFNPRYAKTYYGYSISGTIKCECGKVEESFELSDQVGASEMDEMV